MHRHRVLKHRIERVPLVFWRVEGKKMLCRHQSRAIRRMWKVGNYTK